LIWGGEEGEFAFSASSLQKKGAGRAQEKGAAASRGKKKRTFLVRKTLHKPFGGREPGKQRKRLGGETRVPAPGEGGGKR